ncbi:MAG: 50S ribosomal protein L10 [Candidatus Aenigmatarchaeota archaeon]
MLTREQKAKIIDEIGEIFKTYSTIGFIDFFGLPTREYREMKKKLKENIKDINIKFFKKNLVIKALERINKQELLNYLPNQVGILYSNENPFKIYKEIKKLVAYRFARAGDVAEEDIILKPMVTNIPAGPSIADFQKLKIEVGVEAGKIAIKKEKKLVSKGEKISEQIASLLQKLNIKPIKIRLKVTAMYDGKTVYPKDVLELDEEYYSKEILKAFSYALELSKKLGIYNKYNIKEFLIKAKLNALALGKKANILEKGIIEELIKDAYIRAKVLSEQIKV